MVRARVSSKNRSLGQSRFVPNYAPEIPLVHPCRVRRVACTIEGPPLERLRNTKRRSRAHPDDAIVTPVNVVVSGVARVARNVREVVEAVPGGRSRHRRSAPSYSPFIEADASAGAAELRAQMHEHGHLLFGALLPVATVLEARAEVLELCREVGWIDPAAAPP